MARKRMSRLVPGASAATTAATGTSSNVLEHIAGFCDGRTITAANNSTTYTLQNVTASYLKTTMS